MNQKELEQMLHDAFWIINRAQGWIGGATYDGLGAACKDWLKRYLEIRPGADDSIDAALAVLDDEHRELIRKWREILNQPAKLTK